MSVQEEAKDLFYLIGAQSNGGDAPAFGRVDYGLMPSELAAPQNAKVWNGSAYVNFQHPTGVQWGWINQMIYAIAQRTQKTVYFYKYAAGGTQLATGGPYTSYNRNTLKVNGMNAWNAFKALFPNTAEMKVMWDQGYTDGLTESVSLNYGANAISWFNELRSYYSLADLQILYTKLSNNATGSPYRANVRAGQVSAQAASPYNILLDVDSAPYQDTAHYSNIGAIEVGDLINSTLQTLGY